MKKSACKSGIEFRGYLKQLEWRQGRESNPRKRLCRPRHNHFATLPSEYRVKTKAALKTDSLCNSRNFGAGEEARTLDLNLGKVALYQLSYSRDILKNHSY